jgi:hypothetical protein
MKEEVRVSGLTMTAWMSAQGAAAAAAKAPWRKKSGKSSLALTG